MISPIILIFRSPPQEPGDLKPAGYVRSPDPGEGAGDEARQGERRPQPRTRKRQEIINYVIERKHVSDFKEMYSFCEKKWGQL